MKTIGLLLALLLLALGAYLLIFANFIKFAFGWQDLIFYSIITGIVYIIVRLIGGSINKKFNGFVAEFINGKRNELLIKRGLLRVYGFLIILMLPFLVYLLLLALFVAISFAIYGFLLISQSPRVPVAIIIALAVVPLGTLVAVITGIYRLFFPPSPIPNGLIIQPGEDSKLWSLVNDISLHLQTPSISSIVISPNSGIGVYSAGNLFSSVFGKGQRTLEIGLPSLYGLTVDEFKAILAHEYGHFTNKDTQWGSFTHVLSVSLMSTYKSVPGPHQFQDNGKNNNSAYAVIVSLNPAYWILRLFINLFFRVTNGFSRIQEVMADTRAMILYGGKSFSSGLLKVSTNDLIFNDVILKKQIPDLLSQNKVINNFSTMMKIIYGTLSEKDLKVTHDELTKDRSFGSIFDSHPPLQIRLDYSQRFNNNAQTGIMSVSSLFDDWEDINRKITDLYNQRLISYLTAMAKQQPKETAQTS